MQISEEPAEMPEIQFRPVGGQVCPYIEIRPRLETGSGVPNESLPIKEIMVGPVSEPLLQERAIKAMVDARIDPKFETSLSSSTIPLRR